MQPAFYNQHGALIRPASEDVDQPRPAVQEIANDKNENDAGQRTPGGVANRDPSLRRQRLTLGNTGRNTKPSYSQLISQTVRQASRGDT
jgi:hypothetical protein